MDGKGRREEKRSMSKLLIAEARRSFVATAAEETDRGEKGGRRSRKMHHA